MDSPQQALDALQREINLILEQTGRLFAAANQSAPEAALARASRLKQQLPVSNNRFHQALDVLDEKLQFTKVVMRRDLALARGKSGTDATAKPVEAPLAAPAVPDKREIGESKPNEAEPEIIEVTESDAPQSDTAPQSQAPSASSPKKRPSPSHEDGSNDEPVAKKQALGDDAPVTNEPQTSDNKLELNTNATEQASGEQFTEDKAPDTATLSNTGDLDSLFNDPISAGGMGGDSIGEPDFSTSADLNTEFNFDSFNDASATNDNDNISALLPGLQDYANDNGGAEPDFSSFFTADPATNLGDQSQNAQTALGEQQIDTAQGDSTFDDLFNLTFDMSGGDGNQNGGNDFDFDFS